MDNREIFSQNLKYQMELRNKTRQDISEAIGVSYFTVTSWVNGSKYPRMDKVEKLAEYFGILKSDLIEQRNEEHRQMQKKNDAMTSIVLRMRSDEVFLSAVEALYEMDADKLAGFLRLIK